MSLKLYLYPHDSQHVSCVCILPVYTAHSPLAGASGLNSVTYPLAVWWKGDDDLEFFTLRCRHEDQRTQWQTEINRLITEAAHRRASERGVSKALNGAAAV